MHNDYTGNVDAGNYSMSKLLTLVGIQCRKHASMATALGPSVVQVTGASVSTGP